jgi:hypothetical protein
LMTSIHFPYVSVTIVLDTNSFSTICHHGTRLHFCCVYVFTMPRAGFCWLFYHQVVINSWGEKVSVRSCVVATLLSNTKLKFEKFSRIFFKYHGYYSSDS